jgi:hypothetical protein
MRISEILTEELSEVTDVSKFLSPDQSPGEINDSIFKLMDMLDGAKRGLGIVNKLKNPEDKRRHLRQVFTNLNKIRAAIVKVDNMF